MRAGAFDRRAHRSCRLPTLFFVGFGGVCVVVLFVTFEAVRSVSRKPAWHENRPAFLRAESAPAIQPIEALAVEPRHSGFAGLSNDRDFRLTA